MISLVSLLSLQAHGAVFEVGASTTLENALLQACQNPSGPHTVRINTANVGTVLELGPGSINGGVAVYPPAACNVASPPAITIEPNVGQVTIRYLQQGVLGGDDVNLFTFGPGQGPSGTGVNVTLRNLRLQGRLASEVVDDPGQPFAPRCSSTGDRVRGVVHDGRVNSPGSLTVENVTFNCLNGDSQAIGGLRSGGAILANGIPLIARNSVFDQNTAFEGGAIAVNNRGLNLGAPTNRSLILENSVFTGNIAQFGGAVNVTVPSYAVDVFDSMFFGNFGQLEAGGMNLEGVGAITIERTVFDRQNPNGFDETQDGGAVRIALANGLRFRNNVVCGSWAGRGGGVFAANPGVVDVEGSVFAENGGLCYGGGLYIEGSDDVRVVNNTFVGNEAGRPPPFLQLPEICAIGGGGAAAFFGSNPEFRNNVVAFQAFGGGVLGSYVPFGTGGFQIGDPLAFYNNLWWENEDTVSEGHVTGDFAAIAFHPSNLFGLDPELTYIGPGEYNCTPDAFYPLRGSPTIDAGGGPATGGIPGDCQDWVDTSPVADFVHDAPLAGDLRCDIGAFGGRYGLFAKDTDGDGWSNIFDCNDLDPNVNPGEIDICDFIDNDCDGLVDEDFEVVWYPDTDGDGFGSGNQVLSCTPVPGHVNNSDDCKPDNAAIFPGASEVCNGEDDNCNGESDEGLQYFFYYRDQDGDGFGGNPGVEACQSPGPDYITQGGDCNDGNPLVNPLAPEICGDGIDNNCNGLVDPEDETTLNAFTYYVDNDGDGYGDSNLPTVRRCGNDPVEGFATFGGDCDDTQAEINPGAQELCANQGVDEDCDGEIDETDSNTADAEVVYTDSDGDGFGNDIFQVYYCPLRGDPVPAGTSPTPGDCNDADPLVGECSECGCQATPSPGQGALGLLFALGGLLLRRRKA